MSSSNQSLLNQAKCERLLLDVQQKNDQLDHMRVDLEILNQNHQKLQTENALLRQCLSSREEVKVEDDPILFPHLYGCPFCGLPPEIEILGTTIDIQCCVSMSIQKSDHLSLEERETFDMSTLQYSQPAEAKVLAIACGKWNQRTPPSTPQRVSGVSKEELPYLYRVVNEVKRDFNPNYGLDRRCVCGHTYDRHFDPYEEHQAVGCKYCDCYTFIEAPVQAKKDSDLE